MPEQSSLDILKEQLTNLEVDFDPNASEEDLYKLMEEKMAEEGVVDKRKDKKTDPKLLVKASTLQELANTVNRLTERLAELEKAPIKEVAPTSAPKPKKLVHIAKIRFLDGEMVTGYGRSFPKKTIEADGLSQVRMYLEVFTGAGSTKKKTVVDHALFMEQGEFKEAEIVDTKVKEDEKIQGYVPKTVYNYDKFTSTTSKELVPLTITTAFITYSLKLPTGEIVDLPSEALN